MIDTRSGADLTKPIVFYFYMLMTFKKEIEIKKRSEEEILDIILKAVYNTDNTD